MLLFTNFYTVYLDLLHKYRFLKKIFELLHFGSLQFISSLVENMEKTRYFSNFIIHYYIIMSLLGFVLHTYYFLAIRLCGKYRRQKLMGKIYTTRCSLFYYKDSNIKKQIWWVKFMINFKKYKKPFKCV